MKVQRDVHLSGRLILRRSGALLWLAERYIKMPQASLDSVSILGGAVTPLSCFTFLHLMFCLSEIRAGGVGMARDGV
jgi:hypothetical protein